MTKLKAVLFDFGGTLFDYASDKIAHHKMMEEVIKRYKIEEKAEVLEGKYSNYMWKTYLENKTGDYKLEKDLNYKALSSVLEEYGRKLEKLDWEWLEGEIIKKHCENVCLFPGTIEVLKSLKNMGLFLGMVTDFEKEFLFCLLEKLQIKHFFDVISCSGELEVNKPDPYIFNFALKKLKIKPDEAVYVGDNFMRDVQGAKNVGMRTIFLSNDSNDNNNGSEDLNEADYIIEDIQGVLPVIKELIQA